MAKILERPSDRRISCTDCKFGKRHILEGWYGARCQHPGAKCQVREGFHSGLSTHMGGSGYFAQALCSVARLEHQAMCGENARWFQPAERMTITRWYWRWRRRRLYGDNA